MQIPAGRLFALIDVRSPNILPGGAFSEHLSLHTSCGTFQEANILNTVLCIIVAIIIITTSNISEQSLHATIIMSILIITGYQ